MSAIHAEGYLRPVENDKAVHITHEDELSWGFPDELGGIEDISDVLIPQAHGFSLYVDRIAEAYSCQKCVPATMLLLSLCGLIGSRAGIRPYQNQAKVFYPNTWGGVVSPSGSDKSPILSASLAPLHHVSRSIQQQRTNGTISAQQSNGRGRYLVINDTSPEALGELMQANSGGLVLEKDELAGCVQQWDRDGAQGSREFFLESWEGGRSYSLHRITRGDIYIPSCTLSMIGGIQPAKLNAYVSDALNPKSSRNDGFLQRLQMVVLPSRKPFIPMDVETSIPDSLLGLFTELDRSLQAAAFSGGKYRPLVYRATTSATEFWLQWLSHWMGIVEQESEQHIGGHLSKYRSLMAGLSLVFAIIHNHPKVEVSDMELASGWCDYLSIHARKMYRCTEQGTPTELLADKIKAGKVKDGDTLKAIKDANILGRNTRKVIDAAIKELIAANWIHVIEVGRGSKVIHINPSVVGGGKS